MNLSPVPVQILPLGIGLLLLSPAPAQIVISGNENKIDLTSGASVVIPNAPPDTLSILDFSEFPPDVHEITGVANTVIGPPSNVAIAPDGGLALIANSIRLDPQAPTGFVPESTVHILDLRQTPARVAGAVSAGRQPSGMSFTPDGRSALIANRADGTVSVLRINGTTVSLADTVTVCTPEESLSDVAIHPNGALALASAQKGGYLALLALENGRWSFTGRKISAYGQPYRCVITSDGALGLTAGQGMGNGLDLDALSVVDLTADPIQTVDYVPLGAVPESIDVNPAGDLVAAVTMNGSNLATAHPNHSDQGGLILLRRSGSTFVKSQELPIGRIPEGVAFTSDGRHLVVQCHPNRELWIFAVRRNRVRDTGVRIPVGGMPSSLRAGPAPGSSAARAATR
jgi:DNA-binding beta-propeller fold protein YncE